MTEKKAPRFSLGHTTLAARDLDRLSVLRCDVLGFQVTHRGPVPGGSEPELRPTAQWRVGFAKRPKRS